MHFHVLVDGRFRVLQRQVSTIAVGFDVLTVTHQVDFCCWIAINTPSNSITSSFTLCQSSLLALYSAPSRSPYSHLGALRGCGYSRESNAFSVRCIKGIEDGPHSS